MKPGLKKLKWDLKNLFGYARKRLRGECLGEKCTPGPKATRCWTKSKAGPKQPCALDEEMDLVTPDICRCCDDCRSSCAYNI